MAGYLQFGSGLLLINSNAGNQATNPTPVKPLTIQDITFDISGELKSLRGQYQFPDDVATADKKGTFKFSMGRKDFFLMNQLFSADTVAAGGTSVSVNESKVVASATATVTPPGGGVFSVDLGVTYGTFGAQLTKVASAPAAGQYSVSAGVYTFNSSDNTKTVTISYGFTTTLSGSQTYQINQQTQGYGPQFEAYIIDMYQPVSSINSVIRLYAAKINKIAMNNKRVDYSMPELDGEFFAASSGRVLDLFSNIG